MNPPDRRTPAREESSILAAPAVRDLSGSRLGDFEVDRILGRGGMGEVYLGRQISLNREVAIKVLRQDLASNATYLRRFEVEAWSAAKLNHPNIVQIYLLGEHEGLRFLVMEYVQGTNLREYLRKKGSADLALGLSIMRQAGLAVGAAGEVGLIHRDIKPENLLITRKGVVKVADFGLSRNLDDEKHDVTLPGVTIGTPLYMSPEQARGMAMDHRSDLYSLGVTFYHLMGGEPPFRAETALALAMKHVSDRPVDLAVHNPDLPPDLVRLVMKLIQKDPADRYQTASEMLRDLARIRESLSLPTNATTTAAVGAGRLTNAATATTAATIAIDAPLKTSRAGATATESGRAAAAATATAAATSGPGEDAAPVSLRNWPDRRLLALGLTGSLLLGLGAGWLARPGDLLSEAPDVRHARPAAWLAPGWQAVERRSGAANQYRFAQMLPEGADRDAAWVAVSEYFPGERDWSTQAYTQLARELFRRGDSDRLEAFARGLRRTNHDPDEVLANFGDAGVAALIGEPEKVLKFFDANNFAAVETLIDPSLAEWGLEIVVMLRDDLRWRQGSRSAGIGSKLAEVRRRLLVKLMALKERGSVN